MDLAVSNLWGWFCLAFGIMLLATFIMNLQSRRFFTMDVVIRKFSILDLEFAATPQELVTIISGIYKLPVEGATADEVPESNQVLKALKGQLWIDLLLFIPATYGGLFMLCMQVASKMGPLGHTTFTILTWLQIIPFVLDITENIYLFSKLHPSPPASSPAIHRAYQFLEIIKWGIPLTAAFFAFSALLYFWVSGFYAVYSLRYLFIITGELVVFILVGTLVSSRRKMHGSSNRS